MWAHPLLGYFIVVYTKENLLDYLRQSVLSHHVSSFERFAEVWRPWPTLKIRLDRFASHEWPRDQWAHLAGITSTTATMTWLGSLLSSSLVWTNQLGQKLRTSLLLCSALHILKLYQWRTIQLPCWMVHFDVASASILPGKRLPTDDEAEDELDGFCTGRNRTCQRRFDKITRH